MCRIHARLSGKCCFVSRKVFTERNLNGEFWIAGDEAYMCTEDLITPVPSSHASSEEDSFNFFHSSLRMHVEQAFGMLMAKWGIFQKPLGLPVRKSSRIIAVAMKLHNFCLSKGSCRREGMCEKEFRRVYRESLSCHRRMRTVLCQQGGNSLPSQRRRIQKRTELVKVVATSERERTPVVQAFRYM